MGNFPLRAASTDTWSATPADGNWSTPGNFTGGNSPPLSGDSLTFAGTSTSLTSNNDLTPGTNGFTIGGITFVSGAAAYTLTGNQIQSNFGSNGIVVSDQAAGVTETINLPIYLGHSTIFKVSPSTASLVVGGVISSATNIGLQIGQSGDVGTVTLTGANTFSGTLALVNGTLILSDLGTAVGVASTAGEGNLGLQGGTISYTGSGESTSKTIAVNGGTLANNGSGGLTLTGNITYGKSGIIYSLGGAYTGANTISSNVLNGGFTGGLTVNTAGTWALNGANTYTGVTTLGSTPAGNSAGILAVSTLANGGVVSAGVTQTASGGTSGASTITVGSATGLVVGQYVAGTGIGAGATITNISGTTITLSVPNTGAVSGTIDFGVIGASGSNTITVTNTTGLAVGQAVQATGVAAGATITGISGNTITLSANNTGTVSGNFVAGTANGLGLSTNVASNLIINNGTTFQYTGAAASTDRLFTVGNAGTGATGTIDASGVGAVNFTNTGNVAYGTGGTGTNSQSRTLILTGSNTGANTLAAIIANNGTQTNGNSTVSLTKNGAGTWVLTGVETYTGATTVNQGILEIDGSTTSNATVASGATLQGSGTVGGSAGVTSGNLSGLGSLGLTINGLTTFSGTGNTLTGLVNTAADQTAGAALTVVGELAGVDNLEAGNTSLSGTGIIDGSVTLNGGGNTLSSTGTLTTGGLLVNGLDNSITAGTVTGDVSISSGASLQLSGTTGALSGNNAISDNGSFIINRSNAATQGTDFSASAISGSGAVSQTGSGTTTFTTDNSYTGGTTVSAGQLYVNNGGGSTITNQTPSGQTVTANNTTGSGTGSGAIVAQNSGTLGGSGTITGPVTVQAGGTLVSGAAQTGAQTSLGGGGVDTIQGTGLTLTSTLAINAGGSLTFNLGAGSTTGPFAFSNPNTNSTYLSVTSDTAGGINFGTGAAININLVDLTAYQPVGTGDSLQLQFQNPYLLIAADSDSDYANLVTTGGLDQNGYVLGVGTLQSYTALNLDLQNVNGQVIGGAGLQLYLYNGNLEVVPEPGTWALMLGGLAVLIIIQRRKNNQI